MKPQSLLFFLALALLIFACQSKSNAAEGAEQVPAASTEAAATLSQASTAAYVSSSEPTELITPEESTPANPATTVSKAPTPPPTSTPQADLRNGSAVTPPKSTVGTSASATPEPKPAVVTPPVPVRPDHQAWDALLRAHVTASGQVDYRALQTKMSELDAYLSILSQQPPQQDWPAAEVKAYWINAYNAFTVKLILENYPLQSIRDIDGGQPWDRKWIELGGKTYSLDEIENSILRPRFKDARIHFAVNCAAASCPPLHNRAFTAGNVNSLLERLTKAFVNNDRYNTITAKRVEVSRIFDWYGVDFGDLRTYLNTYSETAISSATPIQFKAYDWSLNGN